jgi:hypothetical protein
VISGTRFAFGLNEHARAALFLAVGVGAAREDHCLERASERVQNARLEEDTARTTNLTANCTLKEQSSDVLRLASGDRLTEIAKVCTVRQS